jgi:hypothetical protein
MAGAALSLDQVARDRDALVGLLFAGGLRPRRRRRIRRLLRRTGKGRGSRYSREHHTQ